MNRVVAALSILLGLVMTPQIHAADLVQPDLGQKAADHLRSALPDYDVQIVDPRTLKLSLHGAEPYTISLDRIGNYCSTDPSGCDAAFERFVAGIVQVVKEKNAPVTAASLRAVIRPARYVATMQRQLGDKEDALLISTPFVGDLVVLCYFDLPTAMRPATRRDLPKLGMTSDVALDTCKRNVKTALPPLQTQLRDIPDRAFATLSGNEYESSYVLFPEDWAALADRLGGRLIIAVPDAVLVLYGKEQDEVSVSVLGELAKKAVASAQRPISVQVFRWTPKGWEVVPN